MPRENTFMAEGADALDDIRAMLDAYEPPENPSTIRVTFEYEEDDSTTLTAEAPAQDASGGRQTVTNDAALPSMKAGTRRHEILELLVGIDGFLTNDEIAERLGYESREKAQTTTSSLHRQHGLLSARKSPDDGARFEYAATVRGEKALEGLGKYNG